MTPHRRDVLRGIAVAGTASTVGIGTATADEHDDVEDALLRVAHASPDAPAVDVYVEGSLVLEAVEFKTITDYLSVPPGDYDVTVTAAGDEDAVVFDDTLTLADDDEYTVVATGQLADDEFEVLVFEDDRSIEDGKAQVRVIHASPDAPNVDVTVGDGDVTLLADLGFGERSDTVTVDPDEYELEVRPASSKNNNPFDAEFDVTLAADTTYLVVATGFFMPDAAAAYEPFDLAVGINYTENDH